MIEYANNLQAKPFVILANQVCCNFKLGCILNATYCKHVNAYALGEGKIETSIFYKLYLRFAVQFNKFHDTRLNYMETARALFAQNQG